MDDRQTKGVAGKKPLRNWEQEVAGFVVEEVFAANRGRWPQNAEDWERLAWRFGCKVEFHPSLPLDLVQMVGNVLHVPALDEKLSIQHPMFRHELAEAALLWEGREPYCYPAELPRAARHRVALLVEDL